MTPVNIRTFTWTLVAAVLAVAGIIASGCGRGSGDDADPLKLGDKKDKRASEKKRDDSRPFPLIATKNSTRVPGIDATQVAAYVARIVYPSFDTKSRPSAIVFVDKDNWRAGVSASALIHEPVNAPILLTDGDELPEITKKTAEALKPTGVKIGKQKRRVKAIRIAGAPAPEGLRAYTIGSHSSFKVAEGIADLAVNEEEEGMRSVVVASVSKRGYALPAAAWAAKSGDPVLYVRKNSIPAATRRALARYEKPNIYILGPRKTVSDRVMKSLSASGNVERISASTAIESAIAFARFQALDFGWGVVDPGHGLVFANLTRPLDAAAAAPLSASGKYGPLLLVERSKSLPEAVKQYLLDIRPGYENDPTRGVYNHAWVVGDEKSISVSVQTQIDRLAEIQPIKEAPPMEPEPKVSGRKK